MSGWGQTGAAFDGWTEEMAARLIEQDRRELARVLDYAAEHEGRWPVDDQ